MMTSCFFFVFSLLVIFDTTTLADSYSSKSKTSSKSKSKKGKAQSDLVQDLLSQIAELELQLSNSISIEESDELIKQTLINEYGLSDWAAASLPVDQSLSSLSNAGRANIYEAAGWPIYYEYSPEPSFYLQYAASDTVVRDMQGDVFKFPETGNKPEDIAFTLPPPPAYEDPSDLIFMPILQIASLLRSGAVDCVTVVQTFINRLDEFDPYLAIVSLPLYDRALEMAAAHDELLAQGTDLGPLMCIPYGVKDHHQIFDDDITTYGNILYANNIQKTKSSVMAQLMKYGAIPIAKTNLGTFASGSVHGHGECMSPYLTGGGGGSSCGSGSGAALGALPFAVSEETSGSIASPSYANLVSGHIGSYGSFSRAGAALLAVELDHLGFHSRYVSDFGAIFNFMRTGVDPLDGDTVDFNFVDPASIDVTSLNVLIVVGEGSWVQDENMAWRWDDTVTNSRNKAAWNWGLRTERIIEKLTAAGVSFDTVTKEEANALWSYNETTPYFNCAAPDTGALMAAGPWAQAQEFEFGFVNSGWSRSTLRNIPTKSSKYLRHCMKEVGRAFLNDPIWSKYDVIIDTHTSSVGEKPNPGSTFEQWVRTAKTFLIDYMEEMPCLHKAGGTVEAGVTSLTALPFNDAYNFAIGSIIQDPNNFVFPKDDIIKEALGGRTRCAYAFYDDFNDPIESCPPINELGGPPNPFRTTISSRCAFDSSSRHLPDGWADGPFVPAYLLPERAPDEGIFRWDEYGPIACTAVCPFLQSFCDLKGIVCDERRLEEEARLLKEEHETYRRLLSTNFVEKDDLDFDEDEL